MIFNPAQVGDYVVTYVIYLTHYFAGGILVGKSHEDNE